MKTHEDENADDQYQPFHALFDEIVSTLGIREYALFMAVMGDNKKKALRALSSFEHDVSTCPPEVTAYGRKLLQEHYAKKST